MITITQAGATVREYWHMTLKNADGTPLRARRNGATQFWKTKPGLFRIPVKHGLKTCFYIQNFDFRDANAPTDQGKGVHQSRNDHQWCIPELWPAEHLIMEGVTP